MMALLEYTLVNVAINQIDSYFFYYNFKINFQLGQSRVSNKKEPDKLLGNDRSTQQKMKVRKRINRRPQKIYHTIP